MDDGLRKRFVEGMSRASTFVAVATTDGPGGRFGVTVSSLTSVAADGDFPTLLFCVNHMSPAAAALMKNRAFCANLLHESQQDVAARFAGHGMAKTAGDHAERFAATIWDTGPMGQPRIAGATAVFECRLATAMLWETHHIIVGRVAAVRLSEDPHALLYGQRGYRRAVQITPPDEG